MGENAESARSVEGPASVSTGDNAASARHVEGTASVSMGDNAANAGTVEGTRLLTNHSGAGRKLKRTAGDAGLIETDGFADGFANGFADGFAICALPVAPEFERC